MTAHDFDNDTPAAEELSETGRMHLFSDTRIRLPLKKTMKTLTRSHKNKGQYAKLKIPQCHVRFTHTE